MTNLVRIAIERRKLENAVSLHGICSEQTVDQSQKLDKLIVAIMLEQSPRRQPLQTAKQ